MDLVLDDTPTGHGFFVCLYRGPDEPAFSDDEARCFEVLARHLLQLWRFALQDALRAGAGAGADIERVAVAARDGRLVHAGTQLFEWIAQRWPGWDGRQLPLPPAAMAAAGEGLQALEQGEHVWLLLQPPQTGLWPRLAPRRLLVAQQFARGHSNKEIARQLGLTPATVRTYLRDAYLELGVRNKVELGEALSSPAARGLP